MIPESIDLTYGKLKVRSSVYPKKKESFNDLACLHAGRSAESLWQRLQSAARELKNK